MLIKHRNCIRTWKSIWNSQVSLPAVTPFPSLGGKHISLHQRLSSWGWIPWGCSDILGADEGKGNLTLPRPPPVPSSSTATSTGTELDFPATLSPRRILSPSTHCWAFHGDWEARRTKDLSPMQSWQGQGSSVALCCLIELGLNFSACSSVSFTKWPRRPS